MNADSRREKKGGARTVGAAEGMHKIKRGRNILAQETQGEGTTTTTKNKKKTEKKPREGHRR